MPGLAYRLGRLRRGIQSRQPVRVPAIDGRTYTRPRLLIEVTHTSNAGFLTGIQRVVLRLSKEMLAQADQLSFEPVMVRLDGSDGVIRLVHAEFENTAPGKNVIRSASDVTIRRNDVVLMLDSSWDDFAVFAKHVFPALRSQGGKVITCLYDLIPLTHPEFCDRSLVFVFERWMPLMLENSDGILCISQATRQSLQDYLRKSGQRFGGGIDYFHLGADFQTLGGASHQRDSDVPTILMVGTLEPRKGLAVALAAFEILWQRRHDIRLRIIGRFGWSIEELVAGMKANPAFGKNLVLEMNCSDQELRKAYDTADLVLSASFVEGFGLPLVEAAALGKSLIVSDIPTYREVCGDDAIYFKSGDANDLADKLAQWLRNGATPKPAKFISWSESARRATDRINALLTSS